MATHRTRLLAATLVLVVGLGSCGDSDDETADTTAPETTAPETTAAAETTAPETTAGADTTAPETSAPETTAAAETTAPETTAGADTTVADGEKPTLAFTMVDFEAEMVTITNTGDAPVSTDGLVMCQFPNYDGIGSETIEPGASIQVDGAIVGGVSAVSGEVALYVDSTFTSAASMITYVEWGTPDHERAPVAVEAGVWDGQAVEAADATSISTDGAATTAAAWTVP